ncbi:MAG: YcxB family protein, partial [[Clostridium] nexile]
MEEKIFVQMTEKALFDFMLFHTYSKFAGFLSNVLGMAVAFIGIILTIMNKATISQLVLYLVA